MVLKGAQVVLKGTQEVVNNLPEFYSLLILKRRNYIDEKPENLSYQQCEY